ncbi:biorientation of chromosomes in cell division protein 1-like [Strongylocentrotus purpuratus]|uniref:BOD1/SHG1 domain-containing protein n=1 Tax=Strongylocentrotus purpuratus TaxID=7668 RepID=A0A7M7NWS8_STRPU|nr:biorientation of chromosomes in cell division protein 1-like [Strongylocentrotus purpuratus]
MSATANGVDPALVTRIVDRVKSQGIFDQFRRDCLADVDTKPAYQNLGTRVEGYVSSFLTDFVWTPDMNKNQLRNSLRRQINESEMLASGVERVIEQVVDAQLQQIFLPRIETVVKEYLHSDNTPSSSDVKPGMESGSIPPQPGQ